MTDSAAPSADSLSTRLLSDRSKRPAILTDCEKLVQAEVDSKGGLSGMAIKGAFKIVTSAKPGFVRDAMDHLLDDFVHRLDPFYEAHIKAGKEPRSFGTHLEVNAGAVADALLGITDDKAKRAVNPAVKGVYDKLRPQAKKHVEDAIPRVGRTLTQHL